MSFLKIIPTSILGIDTNYVQDFQKLGNRYSWNAGIPICRTNYLLPFYQIGSVLTHTTGALATAVSEFKLQKLDTDALNLNTKTVLETTTLTSSLVTIREGDNKDNFYYDAQTDPSITVDDGVYQFYIKITQGAQVYEFISELFKYCYNSNPFVTSGDYDADDYSELDY